MTARDTHVQRAVADAAATQVWEAAVLVQDVRAGAGRAGALRSVPVAAQSLRTAADALDRLAQREENDRPPISCAQTAVEERDIAEAMRRLRLTLSEHHQYFLMGIPRWQGLANVLGLAAAQCRRQIRPPGLPNGYQPAATDDVGRKVAVAGRSPDAAGQITNVVTHPEPCALRTETTTSRESPTA